MIWFDGEKPVDKKWKIKKKLKEQRKEKKFKTKKEKR